MNLSVPSWVPLKPCLNEKLCTEMAVTIVMFEDKIMCSVTPSAVCWLLERKDVWWELLDQGFRKRPVSTNESIDRVTADLSKVGNAATRLSLLPVPGTWYRHHCSLNICEIDSAFLTTIAYDISMVTKFPSFYSIENVTNFSPSDCK